MTQTHSTPVTATLQATTTATSDIREPIFADYFFDNSKGWALGDVNGYTRSISDGQLILSGTNHKELIESLPPVNSFTSVNDFKDFSITITFTLLKADKNDSMGLYLRGDSNLDHDYRIEISGGNTYSISKESLNGDTTAITPLVEPTSTPLLRPVGEQNTLTALMKGSSLELKLNGSVEATVSDSDYTHGQIALFVEHGSTSSGVTAAFSSVEVYPAPEQSPK
jgi:hypothetical protein